MKRRQFLERSVGLGAGLTVASAGFGQWVEPPRQDRLLLSDAEWRRRLTPAQYDILRRSGTERPYSSPLNGEKRKGTYLCVGCDLALFESRTKFDSGTGWPSFWEALPRAVETKADFDLGYRRDEYHCARCGGHHGHVFDDGPKPTGLRYCNNGVVLKFVPAAA